MGNKPNVECQFCHQWSQNNKLQYKICKTCQKYFCSDCNSNPIVLKSDAQKYVNENASLVSSMLCPVCFQKESTIDFTTDADIVGQGNQKTLLWIHGAISCRKMFRVHAQILAKEGYRSILIDVPAHGTEMKTPLTIQNCVDHIYKMRTKYCSPQNPPVVIGGSLGGYMLMETIKKYPKKTDFAGVVVAMASQNVGHGRSLKASMGLIVIQKSSQLLSNQTMGRYFLTMAKNSDRDVIAPMGQSGLFFNQLDRRSQLLRETNSIEGIKAYEGYIYFMNGQKDYHDSLKLWMSSTQLAAKSKIYKDSDHFFSHDRRYLKEFAFDIKQFADQVLNSRG